MRKREFTEFFLLRLRDRAGNFGGYPRLTDVELIERVIRDEGQILRYIMSPSALLDAVAVFPRHAEKLIDIVLEDPNGWRLINDEDSLSELIKGFPTYTDKLVKKAFADPVSFQRTIRNGDDYRHFEGFEAYVAPFIQKMLKSRDEFLKVIHNPYELGHLCFQLPGHADALIKMVLGDPALFDACIRDDAGLQHIKTRFPDISSLQKDTFQQARDAVKKEKIAGGMMAKLFFLTGHGLLTSKNSQKPDDDLPAAPNRIIDVNFGPMGVLKDAIAEERRLKTNDKKSEGDHSIPPASKK